MPVVSDAKALYPMLKAIKDDLHRHPELGYHEERTTARIREEMAKLPVTEIDLGTPTGAAFLLRGDKPGNCVMLRADIDALEQQEPAHEGAVSEYPNRMHACGHDFHTTSLLGAAMLLSKKKSELSGSVIFLFQPAEEPTTGAQSLISAGLMERLPEKPDWLFGLHNRPEVPAGKIAVLSGPIMARKSVFTITVHGTVGHASAPHKYHDALLCGCAIVNSIQSIISRNIDPFECGVCTVTSIHCGTEDGFIGDTLTMHGDFRTLSEEVGETITRRLTDMCTSVAEGYGCTAQVDIVPLVPLTYNAPEPTRLARRAAAAVVGEENIVSPLPSLASEDFAVLGKYVPYFFYWLGAGYEDKPSASWHNANFSTNDDALPLGAALLAESALLGLNA